MNFGTLEDFEGPCPLISIQTGPGGPFNDGLPDLQGRSGGGANLPPHARPLGAVSTLNYLPNSRVLMAPSPLRSQSRAMGRLRTWKRPIGPTGSFPFVATGDVLSFNIRDGANCRLDSGVDLGRCAEGGVIVSVLQDQGSLRVQDSRQHNRGDQWGGDLTGHRSNRGVGEKGAVL